MREHISQKKKTTTGFSIPSLKHPIPGFGLESSAILRQAVPELQSLHKPLTHDLSRIPLRNPQAKLSISQPGDKYEQEADSVAQQVMQRMAQPVNRQSIQRETLPEDEEELQMKPLANSITPLVQREALPEDEEELQMKSLDNSTLQREEVPEDEEELQMKPMVQRQSEAAMTGAPDLEASINQARGGGQVMADNIRHPMEQAFGADFSRVKVHTDGLSDQLNRSIQARAFTTGQDVFFRSGEYNPGSRGGQELLAHELTHVVQQSNTPTRQAQQYNHRITTSVSSNCQPTIQRTLILQQLNNKQIRLETEDAVKETFKDENLLIAPSTKKSEKAQLRVKRLQTLIEIATDKEVEKIVKFSGQDSNKRVEVLKIINEREQLRHAQASGFTAAEPSSSSVNQFTDDVKKLVDLLIKSERAFPKNKIGDIGRKASIPGGFGFYKELEFAANAVDADNNIKVQLEKLSKSELELYLGFDPTKLSTEKLKEGKIGADVTLWHFPKQEDSSKQEVNDIPNTVGKFVQMKSTKIENLKGHLDGAANQLAGLTASGIADGKAHQREQPIRGKQFKNVIFAPLSDQSPDPNSIEKLAVTALNAHKHVHQIVFEIINLNSTDRDFYQIEQGKTNLTYLNKNPLFDN
ncbi:MAG: DUF4157 domain-containing protein [Nostoc sp. DedQUE08]|uniref:eCIS core domain-containing protein n=1 Tax=Nostoc sp. DedQUE08 TaxID=3075393 RepID=UPI002AD33338|nr:DUF4157 domain-containing protein [Nostoc sp. DedQUE08]MDZ8069033.1 DUF4157 domain-containing protein [Nostoc sp. DedQUE08]